MTPLASRLSRLGLVAVLLLPLAPRAGAEDKEKAPPRAIDVLRGGGFGGRESEAVAAGQGPSGGRAAARPALAAKTSERSAPKSAVPAPGESAGGGKDDTILGVNKTVLAGGAALGGIILIGLSGGAVIPVVAGAVLLVGGGAYLIGQASQLAKSITNPLDRIGR